MAVILNNDEREGLVLVKEMKQSLAQLAAQKNQRLPVGAPVLPGADEKWEQIGEPKYTGLTTESNRSRVGGGQKAPGSPSGGGPGEAPKGARQVLRTDVGVRPPGKKSARNFTAP
jgi:hypothetical protein